MRADADDYGMMPGAGPLFEQAEEALAAAEPQFAGSPMPEQATAVERVIAGMIARHRGHGNALPLRAVMDAVGKDERSVRGVVEQLIVAHRMRIGSSEGGYYMIETAEDLEIAIARPKSQIFAMWRRLGVLLAPHARRELLGQMRIEGEE